MTPFFIYTQGFGVESPQKIKLYIQRPYGI